MMRAFEGADAGRRAAASGVCSRQGAVSTGMRPPFSFWSCPKRECAAPGGREKTLRRVGLRQRRPPAAGGGRLAVPRGSQGRKRAALGETFGPGKSGIHLCADFRCRWPVVDERLQHRATQQLLRPPGQRVAKRNARKEKLVKCVLAPRRPPHHPPRDGSIDLAEDPSVPEGQAKSEQAPIRRPPSARRHACAGVRPKRSFLLDRARPVFFSTRWKRKWGVHPRWTSPPGGSQHPRGRRPAARIPRPAAAYGSSRHSGMDMHRGPPRPRDSSALGMV